ncbi:hypothetical protein HDU78_011509 [Chytriomyces hyalinus]|nr:hypothetical protein HDU78_011509 [Chytriomyces hyalinus]
MYVDPEKTAFNVFCKYLKVGQSHLVNAEAGLAVAFQSVVMDPVERMAKFGGKLESLATDYGPAMFVLSQLFYCVHIEGLTTDIKLINQQNQKFSDNYLHLFNTKRPSKTMIGNFNMALARFLSFLELECLKNAIDESKLAHDVPASLKLQYILQHVSRYKFLPLHESFVKLTYENSGMSIHCWAESTMLDVMDSTADQSATRNSG